MAFLRRGFLLVVITALLGATEPAPPSYVDRIPPKYPKEAARKRIEGQVDFELTIGIDGSVVEAVILASEPPGVFDEAAKASVMQWHFSPKCTAAFARPFKGRVSISFQMASGAQFADSPLFSIEERVDAKRPEQRIVQTADGFSIVNVDPCADKAR